LSSYPTSLLPLVGGERLALSELLHRLPDGETAPTSMSEARSPDVRLDTSLELLFDHSLPDGEPRVLATVVATSGSTYRKAGARMLILANGSYVGLLSGGCLEADLKEHADEVLRCGIPRVVEYDMRGPDDILFGIAAGCEGAMRILLEPAGRDTPADRALQGSGQRARAGLPMALVAVHESTDLPLGTYTAAPPLTPALMTACSQALERSMSREVEFDTEGRRTRAFVQYLAPAPHLLICGGGPDAQPVVASARALGWRVTVADHRPVYALATRFPGAEVKLIQTPSLRSEVELDGCHAAVVMSHHFSSDAAFLRELAQAGRPAFVGLLGPAARRARLVRELGVDMEALRPRLRGPVGLDLGAVTPEGIALAIVSQIHAWLAGRAGPSYPQA
jgi:xanthine dehydrogenase accessory factor